jgi:hypothetical protein
MEYFAAGACGSAVKKSFWGQFLSKRNDDIKEL